MILSVAAGLRVFNLRSSPPGIHQDAACNAWIAQCLLKTGTDHTGESWPILYTRGSGGNRTTLYIYLMLPFQALGGMNVWTTRLPSAILNVGLVALLYFVGKRWFGPRVGLAAAAVLTFNPWHLLLSRTGHEAAIAAALGLAPLAAIEWAGLGLGDEESKVARPLRGAAAGVISGVVCYGYHALRLYVPVILGVWLVASAPTWRRRLGHGRHALLLAAFGFGFVLVYGPLAWSHFSNPEVGKYARANWVWKSDDDLTTRVEKVAARYPGHFGAPFLFQSGDPRDPRSIFRPAEGGLLHLYALPLLVVGLGALIRRLRGSLPARGLLGAVACYPCADLLSNGWGLHPLRSLSGLWALALLAGLGAATLLDWARARRRPLAVAVAAGLVVWFSAANVLHLHRFFGRMNENPTFYQAYWTNLLAAAEAIRPILDDVDAVFVTTEGFNQPWAVVAVGLRYDPESWFSGPLEVEREGFVGFWDLYLRFGKIHFMYPPPAGAAAADHSPTRALRDLSQNDRPDRVLFVLRPDQSLPRGSRVQEIRGPGGRVSLVVWELTM